MGGSWPHTNRWVPWLLVVFLAVAWFVPIDSITPRAAAGFDLKLDRVALFGLLLAWFLAVTGGAPGAPRLKGTGVIGACALLFAAVALASVLTHMEVITRLGLATEVFKQLLLLGTQLALFFVVATSLRREELPRMLRVFTAMGIVTAILITYEKFSGVNVFYDLAFMLPPSVFDVDGVYASPINPNPVTGPARHALAVAAMLAMAAPGAVLLALDARGRQRLLWALGLTIILIGVWATSRKTGFIATAISLGALAAYWPGRLVGGVAPVAFVVISVIAALRPRAVQQIFTQLSPENIVGGLSSQGRRADYEAIVPDVRQNFLLGRGWGAYDTDKLRILDNQYLMLLLETGALGLLTFILLIVAVPWAAARFKRHPDPAIAATVTAAVAATAAFAASMGLFDALAFVQVPYFFAFMAGLVAAARRESGGAVVVVRRA